MTTWNSVSRGKPLERALRSLQSQKITLEIVAVDNNSTDATPEICKRYGVRFQKFSGSRSKARNYGMQLAHGEFILFLDSDHEVEPGAISAAVQLAETLDLDAVFMRTRYLEIDPNGRV